MSDDLNLCDPLKNQEAFDYLRSTDPLVYNTYLACSFDRRFSQLDVLRAIVLSLAWERDRYKKIVISGELLRPPPPIVISDKVNASDFLQQRHKER